MQNENNTTPTEVQEATLARANARIEELKSALAGVLGVADRLLAGEQHPFALENVMIARKALQKNDG